jgi:predicted nucleic acid-binding protein
VAEWAVANASPLIFLSKAHRLALLRQLATQVLVPEPVAGEIESQGLGDVTARRVKETEWIVRVSTETVPALIQSWDLGPGESSVLAYSHARSDGVVVIDDAAARRCAEVLGIPVIGTLGVILLAKRRGTIPHARTVIGELKRHGMYLSESTIDRAVAVLGE